MGERAEQMACQGILLLDLKSQPPTELLEQTALSPSKEKSGPVLKCKMHVKCQCQMCKRQLDSRSERSGHRAGRSSPRRFYVDERGPYRRDAGQLAAAAHASNGIASQRPCESGRIFACSHQAAIPGRDTALLEAFGTSVSLVTTREYSHEVCPAVAHLLGMAMLGGARRGGVKLV